MSSSNDASEPSQISSQLKNLQGQAYEVRLLSLFSTRTILTSPSARQTVGSLTGAESWATSGRSLQTQASSELTAAREKQHVDATWDQSAGKLKSAWGMVTGDQDAQTEGNLRAEKGNWNEALSQGKVLPEGGIETVKAKAQT